jgi:methionine synthase II (cobalamin-independent)
MIKKDMLIEDLVQEYPKLVGPLKTEGIVCLACGEAVWGTLEAQAMEKGIQNIDDIVERMNAIILEQTL